jgi:hypothetical protein
VTGWGQGPEVVGLARRGLRVADEIEAQRGQSRLAWWPRFATSSATSSPTPR